MPERQVFEVPVKVPKNTKDTMATQNAKGRPENAEIEPKNTFQLKITEPQDKSSTTDSSVLLNNSDEKTSDSYDYSTAEPQREKVIQKAQNKFLGSKNTESNLFRVTSHDKWDTQEVDRHEQEMEEERQRLINAHNRAMENSSSEESDYAPNDTSGPIDPPFQSKEYHTISTTEYTQLKSLLKTLQADVQRLRTQNHSTNKVVTKETAQPYMDHMHAAEGEAGETHRETEHLTARNTSSNRRAGDSRSQRSNREPSSKHRRRKTRDSHRDHDRERRHHDRHMRRRKKNERSRRRRRRPEDSHYRGDYQDNNNYNREYGGGPMPYDGPKYNPYHAPYEHSFQPTPMGVLPPAPPYMYDPYTSYHYDHQQQYYPSHFVPPAPPILHHYAAPPTPIPQPSAQFTPSTSLSTYPVAPLSTQPLPSVPPYSTNVPYPPSPQQIHTHEQPTINVNYVYSDVGERGDVRYKNPHVFDKQPIRSPPKRRGRSDGHNLNLNIHPHHHSVPSKGTRRHASVGFDVKRVPDLRNIPEEEAERLYSEELDDYENPSRNRFMFKQAHPKPVVKPSRRHARTTSSVPTALVSTPMGDSYRPPVGRVVSNMPDKRNDYEEKRNDYEEKPRRVAFDDDERYYTSQSDYIDKGGDHLETIPPPPAQIAPKNRRHYDEPDYYKESRDAQRQHTNQDSYDAHEPRNQYEAPFEGSNYSYENSIPDQFWTKQQQIIKNTENI